MKNTLKTIGILSIIAFCALGATGCVYREPGWRWHDHERHEFHDHRYGQADFAPPMMAGTAKPSLT